MRTRIITGALALIGVAAMLYFRGWLANLIIVALLIMGLIEEYRAFSMVHKPVMWPAIVAAVLVLPAFLLRGVAMIAPLLVLTTLLVMLVVCFRKAPDWVDAGVSMYPLITVFLPFSLIFVLLNDASQPRGSHMIMLVLVIALAADTFAYFIGVLFGKHKMCPEVSPKKTWEGAVAGLAGSVLGAIATTTILVRLGYNMPKLFDVIVIGVLGGMAAEVGDLSASLVKRHCGIKDFGSIFPGHGGVMDRVDSILFTLMVVCSYALVLPTRIL